MRLLLLLLLLLLRMWVRLLVLGLSWSWSWSLLRLQGSLCLLLWLCLGIVRWRGAVLWRIWLHVRRLGMWLWSLLHLL